MMIDPAIWNWPQFLMIALLSGLVIYSLNPDGDAHRRAALTAGLVLLALMTLSFGGFFGPGCVLAFPEAG
ncbi:MAG: hypothetical protein KA105_02555 [Caulobacter sp.]|nr:hypothetical protein [Caulobacter sp.]